ncbi:MAG: lysophospholipid acyltransferase family protein, partial [Syntrophales bacterium]
MKDFFYRCLMSLARRFGNWIFLLVAWHIALGYFLLFPRRVAVSVRFYRRLFPERPRRHALWCAWQQYHHFVHVFLDRFLLLEGAEIETTY